MPDVLVERHSATTLITLNRPDAMNSLNATIFAELRVAIEDAGLPMPVLQHPVGPYLLDLAYPAIHLSVEYDGRMHLLPERARRDLARQGYLSANGWTILRLPSDLVLHHPWEVAQRVREALQARRSA